MRYKQAVEQTWQHKDFVPGEEKLALVHYATLAASSHNTQPWRFELQPDEIRILPDLSRRCPAVDPDDHHLFASLGCAAENLLIAARAAGLQGTCEVQDSGEVHIKLREAEPERSARFDAILQRQCSRTAYDGTMPSDDQLQQLREAGEGRGTSVLLLTTKKERDRVAGFVAEGNERQFADPAWKQELKDWIRFSTSAAIGTRDGLYGPVMGSPAVPRWLGLLFMRFAFNAKAQNRTDMANLESSPVIAVFYSQKDDKRHWVEAGRCYERVALQSAALGLKHAFINQPVEVPELRRRFAEALGIEGCRPDLVIRIGRGPAMPRSLRRGVDEVLA